MFRFFRENKIELEFRKDDGSYMFNLKNDAAQRVHRHLCNRPELRKTIRELKAIGTDEFKEFIVFECIKECSYIFGDTLEVVLRPGYYIKIIQ